MYCACVLEDVDVPEIAMYCLHLVLVDFLVFCYVNVYRNSPRQVVS